MKKPSVADCLDEIRRLRAENDRLLRLVQTQRPELVKLRSVATTLRDLCVNLPMQLEELHADAEALLDTNADDLPSFDELLGCASDGGRRVDAVIGERQAADAVDPVGEKVTG